MASANNILELHNFSFSFPDGKEVLRNLDWELERGSFALLVGQTGSGKSTLLRQVMEMQMKNQDGEALTIGYVAQSVDNQLICDSVWHELAFALENHGVEQSMMHRRVAEVAHFFGIEPWFNKKVDDLSGGQKQLLCVARALALAPNLFILDEPTSQLDPVAEKNFLHALFRINRELGITVVVATHTPETMLDYATCAFKLEDGKLNKIELDSLKVAISNEELEKSSSDNKTAEEESDLEVDCDDVYVRYAKEKPWVLRGFNLDIQKNSIHALVGGNGCGKSTALLTIATILKIERGKLANLSKNSQAYLPQNPKALFVCDSVIEELQEWQESAGYSDDEIETALSKIGLLEHKDNHPFDLSGGQQQLLALAKLMLTKPKLLLLDEPTKGLDSHYQKLVANLLISKACTGTTIIMATHDLAFAECVATSCTMIFDGENTSTEPAKQFFKHNLFYRPQPNRFMKEWASEH